MAEDITLYINDMPVMTQDAGSTVFDFIVPTGDEMVIEAVASGRGARQASTAQYGLPVTAMYLAPPINAPKALFAVRQSGTRAEVRWMDMNDNEQEFIIERSTSWFGPYAEIDRVSAPIMSYTDSSLSSAVYQYFYRVRAANQGGMSMFSNVVGSVDVSSDEAPSDLQVMGAASAGHVNLNWNNENGWSDGGYYVEASTNGINFSTLLVSDWNLGYPSDYLDLEPGTTYTFRVCAYSYDAVSNYSNAVRATTQQPVTTPPAAPANLNGLYHEYWDPWIGDYRKTLDLSWRDNASNEEGYIVEASLDGIHYSEVLRTPANATSIANAFKSYAADRLIRTPFEYTIHVRVRAFNKAGYSGYSSSVTVFMGSSGGGPM